MLVEVVVVVLVDVAGGGAGAWTLFSVSRTTESSGVPPLPRPPIRYPEPPTAAAAAFDTGEGSAPAARNARVPGSKRDDAVGRGAARRPAEHVDPASQVDRRRVGDGLGEVGNDPGGPGGRVDRLNGVGRPAGRSLATEEVDRVARDGDRGIADRHRKARDALEGAAVSRLEHARVESAPVVAAEDVGPAAHGCRGEVRARPREVPGARSPFRPARPTPPRRCWPSIRRPAPARNSRSRPPPRRAEAAGSVPIDASTAEWGFMANTPSVEPSAASRPPMTQTRSPTATAASPDTGASSGRLMVRATSFRTRRRGVAGFCRGGRGPAIGVGDQEHGDDAADRCDRQRRPPARDHVAASRSDGERSSSRASVGQASAARRACSRSSGGTGSPATIGIAPVVELDPLGQQLGAHAVRVAGDRIDSEPHAHQLTAAGSRAPGVGSRPRMPGGGTHGRRRSWRSISHRRRRGSWTRAAPRRRGDGRRRGPRRRRSSAPPTRACPARRVPTRCRAGRPAIAARPWTHGPHWPATACARYSATRGRLRDPAGALAGARTRPRRRACRRARAASGGPARRRAPSRRRTTCRRSRRPGVPGAGRSGRRPP